MKEMLYAVRCLKSNEDMILALAGQFMQFMRGSYLHLISNNERVDGHRQKSSSICKHYFSEHKSNVPPCF